MSSKTVNHKAWWLVLPVVVLVGFNAIVPLMAVVNYSVQETFGNNRFFFEGVKWFDEVVHSPRFYGALRRQLIFTAIVLALEVPLGVAIALAMPRRGAWASACLVLMSMPLLIPWNVVGAIWNIFALPDLGLLGWSLNAMGSRLQLHPAADRRMGDAGRDGRLALDVPRDAPRLRRPQRHPRRVLPGGEDRRRVGVGRLPPRAAAEDEARADDRDPAPVHGQLHDLHRGDRADRRGSGQRDDVPVHRPGQGRAGTVRPRPGGGDVADLLPDHPACCRGCSTG